MAMPSSIATRMYVVIRLDFMRAVPPGSTRMTGMLQETRAARQWILAVADQPMVWPPWRHPVYRSCAGRRTVRRLTWRCRVETIRLVCGHDCPDMCSLLAHVEDGKVHR